MIIKLVQIPSFLNCLFCFFLFGVIIFKRIFSRASKILIALCFETFVWQFCWFISYFLTTPPLKDLIVRIAWSTIIFIPFTFYHFDMEVLEFKSERRTIFFGYFFATIFLILLWANKSLISGYKEFWWGFYPSAGILHPIYIAVAFYFITRGLFLLAKERKNEKLLINKRNKIRYVFFAHTFYYFAVVEYLINYGVGIFPIGAFFIVACFVVLMYAISKDYLFDIDKAYHYTFMAGVGSLIGFAVTSGLLLLLKFLFPNIFLLNNWVILTASTIAAVFIFSAKYILDFLYWISNEVILHHKYDYLKIIPERVNKWLRDINLRKLKPMVESDLKEVMGFEGAGIYLAGDWVIGTHEACKFFYSINPEKIDDDGVAKIARDSWLVKFMKTQQRVLFLSDLKKEMKSLELPEPVREERREVLRELEALKAETVLPVIFEDAYLRYVVGVVVLSRWPLKNLDEVASDDRIFFEKLAEDISAAVGQAVEKEKTEISDKRKTEMTMQLIKETQKLEQEKSQAQEALAKSEEKTDEIADMASVFATKIQLLNETLEDLEVITSNSQAGLLTIRDGRIKSANHKAEIFLLSKGLAKIVGEPYEKVFADKFENLNLLLEDIKKVLAKGTTARNFETKWLNDNESIPVELKITPLRDVRNFAKITGALVEIVDISEVKERQRLLNIKDKFETFREVVQGFNHEVRNPLNILNTLVYSLKNLKEKIMADPEFFNDFCSVVPQAIKNIEDLLKDLTDVEIPKKLEGAESLNIQKSAEGVLAEFAERTEKAKIEMVEEFSPLPLLIANPKHFKIIFYEVFKNSIEAIEEYDRLREMGQGERLGGKIFIKGRINEAGEVEIKIVDTGIGIDESELDKVVNPFHTSKTHSVTKPESGTGLGLSRVYSILQNYGGALKIESKLREGTTITMTFKKEMTV